MAIRHLATADFWYLLVVGQEEFSMLDQKSAEANVYVCNTQMIDQNVPKQTTFFPVSFNYFTWKTRFLIIY